MLSLAFNGVQVAYSFASAATLFSVAILLILSSAPDTRSTVIATSVRAAATSDQQTPLERCLQNPFTSPGYLTASKIDPAYNRWNPFISGCSTPSLAPLVASRSSLPWLRNRTVVVIGVSVDRNHVRDFCEIVKGKFEAVRWWDERSPLWDERLMGPEPSWTKESVGFDSKLPHLCTVEDYGFMIVQVFHYVGLLPRDPRTRAIDVRLRPFVTTQGLANPVHDHWKSTHPCGDGEYHPGYFGPPNFEDRVSAHLVPLLTNLGRRHPDLIEVSASEWDIEYWKTLPIFRTPPYHGNKSLIYDTDLQTHIPTYLNRLEESASFVLSLFPRSLPLLWRVPVELPARGWPYPLLANVVDQATRSVFVDSEEWDGFVELDETGTHLRGSGETDWYESASHPAKVPHSYVWSDFILWRLQGVSEER
ncbi:hypothetical protein P7C70_g1231, partial [Phenoliferia sp. Uapishka_3]